MHAATWDGPDLRHIADPQVLSADQLRRMISAARRLTHSAREHWFDLSPDERMAIVRAADTIDAQMLQAEAAVSRMRKRDLFIALWTGLRALMATMLSRGTNSALLFTCTNELINFRNAVREQQDAQRAIERAMLDRVVASEPDLFVESELLEAREAYTKGFFVSMKPSELRARASQKVQAGEPASEKAQAEA